MVMLQKSLAELRVTIGEASKTEQEDKQNQFYPVTIRLPSSMISILILLYCYHHPF